MIPRDWKGHRHRPASGENGDAGGKNQPIMLIGEKRDSDKGKLSRDLRETRRFLSLITYHLSRVFRACWRAYAPPFRRPPLPPDRAAARRQRSEERRVGKE